MTKRPLNIFYLFTLCCILAACTPTPDQFFGRHIKADKSAIRWRTNEKLSGFWSYFEMTGEAFPFKLHLARYIPKDPEEYFLQLQIKSSPTGVLGHNELAFVQTNFKAFQGIGLPTTRRLYGDIQTKYGLANIRSYQLQQVVCGAVEFEFDQRFGSKLQEVLVIAVICRDRSRVLNGIFDIQQMSQWARQIELDLPLFTSRSK